MLSSFQIESGVFIQSIEAEGVHGCVIDDLLSQSFGAPTLTLFIRCPLKKECDAGGLHCSRFYSRLYQYSKCTNSAFGSHN